MHRVIYAPRTIAEAEKTWDAIKRANRDVIEMALFNELAFQLPIKVVSSVSSHPARKLQRNLELLRNSCSGHKKED